jgi:hypothetical protein
MPTIKIRYNTQCRDDVHHWRVLVDGVEILASEVRIECPTFTTRDVIEGVGEVACDHRGDYRQLQGTRCVIR